MTAYVVTEAVTTDEILETIFSPIFSSVQSLSHVRLIVTPWTTAHQAPCPFPTPGVYSNSSPLSC